jgi:hypothetical protein
MQLSASVAQPPPPHQGVCSGRLKSVQYPSARTAWLHAPVSTSATTTTNPANAWRIMDPNKREPQLRFVEQRAVRLDAAAVRGSEQTDE